METFSINGLTPAVFHEFRKRLEDNHSLQVRGGDTGTIEGHGVKGNYAYSVVGDGKVGNLVVNISNHPFFIPVRAIEYGLNDILEKLQDELAAKRVQPIPASTSGDQFSPGAKPLSIASGQNFSGTGKDDKDDDKDDEMDGSQAKGTAKVPSGVPSTPATPTKPKSETNPTPKK